MEATKDSIAVQKQNGARLSAPTKYSCTARCAETRCFSFVRMPWKRPGPSWTRSLAATPPSTNMSLEPGGRRKGIDSPSTSAAGITPPQNRIRRALGDVPGLQGAPCLATGHGSSNDAMLTDARASARLPLAPLSPGIRWADHATVQLGQLPLSLVEAVKDISFEDQDYRYL
jgi:hypothetical protein